MSRVMMIVASLGLFICTPVLAGTDKSIPGPQSLLLQAEGVPAEFQEYLFDVPLAVRVERDSQWVGDALVVLSRDERVMLLEFTDIKGSPIRGEERDVWSNLLSLGIALGPCKDECPQQLLAVHYRLDDSVLSLLTAEAEAATDQPSYYEIPQDGSTGLILRNQLNLSGGQDENSSGRYNLQASSSLGNWTQIFNAQLSRYGGEDQDIRHSIQQLYTQRELEGHFLRLGYFFPSSEGLARQPRSLGRGPGTALGVMAGSSSTLAISGGQPSVYPIYVTANRQATVEIYRDGALINTQAVESGLHTLDTHSLPSGIYDVEVRLVEDGKVTSTARELVYKPTNWSNTDERWRYNLFVGREKQLWSNWENPGDASATAGAAINYLAHPRAVLGLSARLVKELWQYGSSIDLTVTDKATLYANVYQTELQGSGVDLQGIYNYDAGSVVISHDRSWLDNRDTYETLLDGTRVRQRNTFVGQTSNSSLSINHRLNRRDSFNGRVSYSDGYQAGIAMDLGWTRYDSLFGNAADWRVSIFDRPGSFSSGDQRNRGVELSLNLSLGGEGSSISASFGSRTSREGKRESTASVTYSKDLQEHVLQSVSVTANHDSYGVGVSGSGSFRTRAVTGDAFIQRSSYNGKFSGGVNLDSVVAVGGGKIVMSGEDLGSGAGMIVDLESDIDDILLRADDLSGGTVNLKPGRNYLPVKPYKSGLVSFDFDGTSVPAGSIQPARTSYHLNKGGVEYRQVRVMKTLTVLGRLLDEQGRPLKGYHLINHASRGVSEVDGFFSMEMSVSTPELEVRSGELVVCRFRLDAGKADFKQNVLMAGDLRCMQNTLAKK